MAQPLVIRDLPDKCGFTGLVWAREKHKRRVLQRFRNVWPYPSRVEGACAQALPSEGIAETYAVNCGMKVQQIRIHGWAATEQITPLLHLRCLKLARLS
ncbi:MAG: hypothetical protein EB015_17665 [Methylocystaceae bacterium]|nr:hypothetical protein [Methylocystaceae bacterium]